MYRGTEPLLKEGDRTDFRWYERGEWYTLVGTVERVERGSVYHGQQMEHSYVLKSNHELYRVFESDVSTPYGPNDD